VDPIAVLDEPHVAAAAMDPLRARLLARLAVEPASAATLAKSVGVPRQKVGYHLGVLVEHGLVVEVEQRRHGGLVERVHQATAASYLVSPAAVGEAGADPGRIEDRLSAAYLLALAGRAIREVGVMWRDARRAGKRLPILSIDTDIRFASAADREAFAAELAAFVRSRAARYHDASASGGRWYRVVALSHPRPQESST
jgi:DNA-binding transcriptional ArsR family regulator